MLNTLLKIGEWQSMGKSEWARFLDNPKVEPFDKNGNPITHYILPIIFDLDKMEVVIDAKNMREYDESFIEPLKLLKTLSARNKKIYATVKGINLKYLFISFFGVDINNSEPTEGHLLESIRKDFPNLFTGKIQNILNNIEELKKKFLELTLITNERTQNKEISIKAIQKNLNHGKFEEITIVYVKIKANKYGIDEPIPFAKFDDYQKFLKAKLLTEKAEENRIYRHSINEKLCYASGHLENNVSVMDLPRRDSLNKMFGAKTYASYLPNFDMKDSHKSYQVSDKNKVLLDFASNYLVEKNRLINIAGIKHCFIPEFLSSDKVDIEMAISDISNKSDLIFSYKTIDNVTREIKAWTDNIFWISFLAVEIPLDKKYLKTQGVIKDVSIFYFEKVLKAFLEIDDEFNSIEGVHWTWVKGKSIFNLYSIFRLIPVRKENINVAYVLLKSIFEGRKVNSDDIFKCFCELILCYYFKRFDSYTNQKKPHNDDYFNVSVRNIVFKYHAFIQVLKKLNLINMEEIKPITEETGNKYDQAILDFLNKMQLNQEQQAMFYLGRMLNAVEFIQKGKKRTVINKVNFNGMDRDDIQRLRIALYEKAKQYSKIGKVIFSDRKFGDLFDYNSWNLNPQEAVFFLLTGYSFAISKKEAEEIEDAETEEIEN